MKVFNSIVSNDELRNIARPGIPAWAEAEHMTASVSQRKLWECDEHKSGAGSLLGRLFK